MRKTPICWITTNPVRRSKGGEHSPSGLWSLLKNDQKAPSQWESASSSQRNVADLHPYGWLELTPQAHRRVPVHPTRSALGMLRLLSKAWFTGFLAAIWPKFEVRVQTLGWVYTNSANDTNPNFDRICRQQPVVKTQLGQCSAMICWAAGLR